jgi:arsenate reductase
MSEALFTRAAEGRHEARSAGTRPADDVHDNVVTVMRELDVDLSARTPRLLTTDLAQWADVVVTMGCGDECPFIPGRRYIDWELQDPSGLPIDNVRAIRDDISSRITDLVDSLDRKTF